MIAGRGKDGRHEGRDTNRRDKRGKEDCEGNGGGRERERGGGEKDRERKREVVYPGQNNYLPFLHAGGTFSPLKTWEGEPPLEVCELPPTERTRTYTHMRCFRMRVYLLYTSGHSSSSRRALPRPHETEVGFSLYGYSTTETR